LQERERRMTRDRNGRDKKGEGTEKKGEVCGKEI
jgi:hypothetical protein